MSCLFDKGSCKNCACLLRRAEDCCQTLLHRHFYSGTINHGISAAITHRAFTPSKNLTIQVHITSLSITSIAASRIQSKSLHLLATFTWFRQELENYRKEQVARISRPPVVFNGTLHSSFVRSKSHIAGKY